MTTIAQTIINDCRTLQAIHDNAKKLAIETINDKIRSIITFTFSDSSFIKMDKEITNAWWTPRTTRMIVN